MFYGNDPDGKGYSTRAHLAEVVGMLGPPPLDLLERGKRSQEFFTEDGTCYPFILKSTPFNGTILICGQGDGKPTWKYEELAWNNRRRFLKGGIKTGSWIS